MSYITHDREGPQFDAWRSHVMASPRRSRSHEQYAKERAFWTKHRVHSKRKRYIEVPIGRGFDDWAAWASSSGPERDFYREKAWWMDRRSTEDREGHSWCCLVA